jgi:hypothetical protein
MRPADLDRSKPLSGGGEMGIEFPKKDSAHNSGAVAKLKLHRILFGVWNPL